MGTQFKHPRTENVSFCAVFLATVRGDVIQPLSIFDWYTHIKATNTGAKIRPSPLLWAGDTGFPRDCGYELAGMTRWWCGGAVDMGFWVTAHTAYLDPTQSWLRCTISNYHDFFCASLTQDVADPTELHNQPYWRTLGNLMSHGQAFSLLSLWLFHELFS